MAALPPSPGPVPSGAVSDAIHREEGTRRYALRGVKENAVKQCSVFNPPTAITCEKRCLHLAKMKAAA